MLYEVITPSFMVGFKGLFCNHNKILLNVADWKKKDSWSVIKYINNFCFLNTIFSRPSCFAIRLVRTISNKRCPVSGSGPKRSIRFCSNSTSFSSSSRLSSSRYRCIRSATLEMYSSGSRSSSSVSTRQSVTNKVSSVSYNFV